MYLIVSFSLSSCIESAWLHPSASGSQLWTWGADPAADISPTSRSDLLSTRASVGDDRASVSPIPLCEAAVIAPKQQENSNADIKDEADTKITENKLNLRQLSLLEISLEDICPGPARGELYGYQTQDQSDTDSYYSLSLDEGDADEGAATDGDGMYACLCHIHVCI